MTLALLPPNQIKRAFKSLADDHPDSLDDLFDYFESYWIKTVPITLWNVSKLKIRTNNNAEGETFITTFFSICCFFLGWHNRFANRIDKKHPNIWHFIHVLQQEEVQFNQLAQHVKMGKKKLIYNKTLYMQECLDNLTDQYEKKQITLTKYMEGLSLIVAKSI